MEKSAAGLNAVVSANPGVVADITIKAKADNRLVFMAVFLIRLISFSGMTRYAFAMLTNRVGVQQARRMFAMDSWFNLF